MSSANVARPSSGAHPRIVLEAGAWKPGTRSAGFQPAGPGIFQMPVSTATNALSQAQCRDTPLHSGRARQQPGGRRHRQLSGRCREHRPNRSLPRPAFGPAATKSTRFKIYPEFDGTRPGMFKLAATKFTRDPSPAASRFWPVRVRPPKAAWLVLCGILAPVQDALILHSRSATRSHGHTFSRNAAHKQPDGRTFMKQPGARWRQCAPRTSP
jgi:hypothetical protein